MPQDKLIRKTLIASILMIIITSALVSFAFDPQDFKELHWFTSSLTLTTLTVLSAFISMSFHMLDMIRWDTDPTLTPFDNELELFGYAGLIAPMFGMLMSHREIISSPDVKEGYWLWGVGVAVSIVHGIGYRYVQTEIIKALEKIYTLKAEKVED